MIRHSPSLLYTTVTDPLGSPDPVAQFTHTQLLDVFTSTDTYQFITSLLSVGMMNVTSYCPSSVSSHSHTVVRKVN